MDFHRHNSPNITYRVIVWSNRANKYKKHFNGGQRQGMPAMAHVHHSTSTAGFEAILDIMPLDLFPQGVAVQAAFRIWGRNQRWDGISQDNLWGHLFWSEQHLKQANLGGDYSITRKKAIKDLFHDSTTARTRPPATCRQAQYWIDVPGSIGDAMSCLHCPTLSIVL